MNLRSHGCRSFVLRAAFGPKAGTGCYRPAGSPQSSRACRHMCFRVSKFPTGPVCRSATGVEVRKGPACHQTSAGAWPEALSPIVLQEEHTRTRTAIEEAIMVFN